MGTRLASPGNTGLCPCKCGASAAAAATSDATGDPLYAHVAEASACTAALCRLVFPAACSAGGYVEAQPFQSYGAVFGGVVPSASGPGAICTFYAVTVTAPVRDLLQLPSYMLNCSYSRWALLNASQTAQQCANDALLINTAAASSPAAVQAVVRCNTNLCNTAPPGVAPASSSFLTSHSVALALALGAATALLLFC